MGMTECPTCAKMVADPLLWTHEKLHDRCVHNRLRIDPCFGCGREYVDGVLVGEFLVSH